MLTTLIILISILLLAVILFWPLGGLLLLWPILFCYPHALAHDLLPYNIGFDDLYISVLFAVTILRRTQGGQGIRFGIFGFLSVAFWIVFIVGQLYSLVSLEMYGGVVVPLVKGMIKNGTFIMVALTVLNAVDDMQDLVRLVRWYLIGAGGLSVVAILQYFYPQTVAAFYNTDSWAPGEAVFRATGTTKGPWEIGAVLGVAIVMAMAIIVLGRGAAARPLALTCGLLSMAAIILSTSRAGWGLTCVGVFTILVYGKRPILGTAAIGAFVLVVFAFPVLTERITRRVDYTFKTGQLDSSSSTRIQGWKRMVSEITPATYFTGRGTLATSFYYHMTPHNYYLAILLQFGLVGVFYFVCLAVSLVRAAKRNLGVPQDRSLIAIWKGIVALNLGILLYSVTSDTLNSTLVGQVLFFFWAMLYLRPFVADSGTVPAWEGVMDPVWAAQPSYWAVQEQNWR